MAEMHSPTGYEPKDLTEESKSMLVKPMFFHRSSMTSTYVSAESIVTSPPEPGLRSIKRKDLSSDEMETLRRSRNPTTVVTANREVQKNEEAQVYVHDLDLFVTVQILDDTPAVLSLGKLCEEHGYTYGWASGQEPRLTKQGKKSSCKTENFAPLIVPGFSSKFWCLFVLHAVAGLVEYIFKSSIRAK